jgi:hypothetical protein
MGYEGPGGVATKVGRHLIDLFGPIPEQIVGDCSSCFSMDEREQLVGICLGTEGQREPFGREDDAVRRVWRWPGRGIHFDDRIGRGLDGSVIITWWYRDWRRNLSRANS